MKIVKVITVGAGAIITLLAVLMFVLGAADLPGTVFESKTINYFGQYNWQYVQFNAYRYLKSLETSLSYEQFTALNINVPQLPTLPKSNDVLGWFNYIAKILAVFLPNILIMILNIIITPFKLILYPAKILTALIGVDTQQSGFLQFTADIYSFNIPFILYW